MKLACNLCGGTGRVKNENGHVDICDNCLGLGYLNEEDEKESEEKRRRTARFYMLMSLAAVALGLYYVGLYVALKYYGISLILTMVLFVGGHLVIFGGFLLYVLYKVLKNSEENGKSEYR